MVESKLTINGKVQGVFFRAEAAEKAQQLSLKGWVKNEDNGTVSCCVQGEKQNIEKFIDWCRSGPALSDVASINIAWNQSPASIYPDFSIYRI